MFWGGSKKKEGNPDYTSNLLEVGRETRSTTAALVPGRAAFRSSRAISCIYVLDDFKKPFPVSAVKYANFA